MSNTTHVLRTDAAHVLDALDAAARLARSGTAFDVDFALPDNRATIANLAARTILAENDEPAARLAAIDALAAFDATVNGTLLEELSPIPGAVRATAADLALLAPRMRVSSWSHSRRLTLGLGVTIRRILETPSDARVPAPPANLPAPGERVVIWAPEAMTADVLIPLVAAATDGAPIDIICRGGDTYGYDIRVLDVAYAAQALAAAGVIVACDADRPGTAVALAAWGRPLCAPTTSGANQWLRGLLTYRPWSRSDCAFSIAAARAQAAPEPTVMRQNDVRDDASARADGPPVRIIVRGDDATPNAMTAAAIAAQRYAPVSLDAANAAFEITCDDGDVLYPDAIARMVDALERSGADRVTADVLVTYVMEAPGPPVALGYAVVGLQTASATVIAAVPMSSMVRRVPRGTSPDVRLDAVIGTTHRYVDGRLPFRPSQAAQPLRPPALRLQPPRPI